MVGSALVRALQAGGYNHVILRPKSGLDLRQPQEVDEFFAETQPEYVFLAAAKVGGIWANHSYPADFLYDNLAIQTNVIHQAHVHGVKKLLLLGSSCIYPRDSPQPIKEEYLLTGPLEPTNEPYAIAKIAGIKLCESFNQQYGTRYTSVMPTNLYGPRDNYDLKSSHVLPALIRKAHEAKLRGDERMQVWGSGRPRREFLHVDDLADACIYLMETGYAGSLLNIGTGTDVTIRELAEMVVEAVGLEARLEFDASKPDGTPRKLLDVSRLDALGWRASIPLEEGIAMTYRSFLEEHAALQQ